uniref:Plastid lipid-associated protein/fibrillin conserved domain-containing protein n=1 Tax=Chromera velia CCMP2878 TaxID=1169474 RepID=A0A0G4F478_9ALVE|mmetsp:Transcript_42249/g.83362  ORF Transcript_42249/g.83362 Transcript_42249/m.83362 type:complete len:482 (+) Transcript_42249:43-1488(+)|eukprot:Cvel_15011.t1-p1 / transcript=Cvel_15011.t1 / gene=Cvel_15011 / organism=Chromera_velia_CCMP2878 / gene_product=hypothetical protein / transcript_product=hypothetical protein / location=Cvel_scaffold1092:41747-45075(+) / protein_length=481 / sequence_SO=supercontig / SO=protein_coding / is_pseudo=false
MRRRPCRRACLVLVGAFLPSLLALPRLSSPPLPPFSFTFPYKSPPEDGSNGLRDAPRPTRRRPRRTTTQLDSLPVSVSVSRAGDGTEAWAASPVPLLSLSIPSIDRTASLFPTRAAEYASKFSPSSSFIIAGRPGGAGEGASGFGKVLRKGKETAQPKSKEPVGRAVVVQRVKEREKLNQSATTCTDFERELYGEWSPECLGVRNDLLAPCPVGKGLLQRSCVASQDDHPDVFDAPWDFGSTSLESARKILKSVVASLAEPPREMEGSGVGRVRGQAVGQTKKVVDSVREVTVQKGDESEERYLRFEVQSRLFGLFPVTDDWEFFFTPSDTIVQFRGQRRGGVPDFGANRERLDSVRIATRWQKVPVLRDRRRVLFFIDSPWDTFGPPTSGTVFESSPELEFLMQEGLRQEREAQKMKSSNGDAPFQFGFSASPSPSSSSQTEAQRQEKATEGMTAAEKEKERSRELFEEAARQSFEGKRE